MAEHGVFTIMQADVENSTAFTTRVGDELGNRVRDETKRLVREVAEAHGGREIDAVGDAMMLTFDSTRRAIAAAIAIQNALADRAQEHPDESLRVRIGINVGEVLHRDGHPAGAAVNAAARVMAKAHGGQIFVSEMVRQLAGTVPGVTYRDRGRHSFKGWEQKWRLYEVDWRRPAPPPRPKRVRKRPSRRALLVGSAALVAAGAALAGFLALNRPGGLGSIRPNHVGVIDPETNEIVDEIQVGIRPGPVDVGRRSVWVGNLEERSLTKIDARRRSTAGTIALDGRTPTGVAVGANAVWVAHGTRGQLSRVDPQSNQVTKTSDVANPNPTSHLGAVDVGAGSVWAVYGESTLARIEPADARVTGSTFAGAAPAGIVVGNGFVWVANSEDASVMQFNPDTYEEGPIRPLSVGRTPTGIASGEGAIWVANTADDRVTRIDPRTGATTAIPVGDGPTAVAVGAGAVWVANTAARSVSRIDPATYEEVRTIDVGNAPAGVAVGGGFVWVTVQAP